jgi:hypothetical protein
VVDLATLWPGDDPSSQVLGLAVRSWARVGKGAQYVGGLAALVDIVGPEALTRASNRFDRWQQRVKKPREAPILLMWFLLSLVVPSTLTMSWLNFPKQGADPSGTVLVAVLIFVVVWAFGAGLLFYVGAILLYCLRGVLASLAFLSRSHVNLKVLGFILASLGFAVDLLCS